MAPEVFKGNYGMKADIWSIGIILYTMVSGHMPFEGANPAINFKKIAEADIDIDREEFKNVSEECKDLIKKIFVLDVDQRCSAMTALQHPWFSKMESTNEGDLPEGNIISDEVIQNLRNFRGVSVFKKAAMNLIVKQASEADVEDLKR